MKLILPTSILAVIALFLLGAPLHAGTKVGWSVSEVSSVVAVGDRKPVRVTLIAQDYLPAARLETTPGLEDWVIAISPSELPAMAAGDEATIDLVVSAGWVGTNDGTLHVRELDHPRTLAKPLPIVLEGVATIEETLPPPEPEGVEEFTDADGDGVPDDAQRSIESGDLSRLEKEVLLEYARVARLQFDPATFLEAYSSGLEFLACAYAAFPPGDGQGSFGSVREPVIRALLADSPERAQAYIDFQRDRSVLQEQHLLAGGATLGEILAEMSVGRDTCPFDMGVLE